MATGEAGGAPATLPDALPPSLPDDIIDLIHCLGFVYLRHGQANRAVVLLIIAAQDAPDRVDVLRTLAAALIAAGLGQQALDVLDRITGLTPQEAGHPMIRLMRARALLLLGERDEARSVFRALPGDTLGSAAA